MTNLKFIVAGEYIEVVDTVDNLCVAEIWLGDPIEVLFQKPFTFIVEELLEITEYMKGIENNS